MACVLIFAKCSAGRHHDDLRVEKTLPTTGNGNAQLKAHIAQLEARLTEAQAKNEQLIQNWPPPKKLEQFIQTALQ